LVNTRDWRWYHYYSNLVMYLGRECYRTWRWELVAGLLVATAVYLINRNWTDFRTVLLATAIAFACFGLIHLVRLPWLLHRHSIATEAGVIFGVAEEPSFDRSAALFGTLVIVGIGAGSFLGMASLWNARPVPEPRTIFIPDTARDEEIRSLTKKNEELQSTCNQKEQMESLFEDERSKFLFTRVRFYSNPYMKSPSGEPVYFPRKAGYEPAIEITTTEVGSMKASQVKWRTYLTISDHLDEAEEDKLFERAKRTKPAVDRDLVKGDIIMLRAHLGRNLTEEEESGLLADTKFFYVVLIGEYRDKLGLNTSEFCGHYKGSSLAQVYPCHKHNR